jgi:hypothetical protein
MFCAEARWMPGSLDAYLEGLARLEQSFARCDGLIVDLRQREQELRRWSDGVAQRSSIEVIEAALSDFTTGELPSWTELRAALDQWVRYAQETCQPWNALSAEDRTGIASPPIQLPDEEDER